VFFLAILTTTRAIVVWILFLAVFISLGMSHFLSTYSPFPHVFHPLSLILPHLLHVANLPKQHNSYTNSSCHHPLPQINQPPLLLPRQPPPLLLLRQLPPLLLLPWQSFPMPRLPRHPLFVSSAALDASTPSPPPPPRAVSILAPTNDHPMRNHAKSFLSSYTTFTYPCNTLSLDLSHP
jgi:hypothetical protein